MSLNPTQMGPSGSGKTTLLDVLAGRKTVGEAHGSILFGGSKPSRAFLRRFTGYVEQFDTLLGSLTVEEMLAYTGDLKRPITESAESKKTAVEAVLEALALLPCRDVKIGNAASKGISGGQAKRVNIGLALITNPRVLFLDEPTSGLDPEMCVQIHDLIRATHDTQPQIAAQRNGAVRTTIVVTHDTELLRRLKPRVVMLHAGRVLFDGAFEAFVQSDDPHIAPYLSQMHMLHQRNRG